jgi:hypothetical protein
MRKQAFALAVGLTIFAASAATLADTYQDVEHTCPIDGQKFKWRAVMSASFWGQRLDGRIRGATPVPWPHPVCPASGFMMYREERDMTPDYIAKARALVRTEEYRRLRATESPHFLGGYSAEKLGEEPWRVLNLYQDAAWDMENRRSDKHPAYLRVVVEKMRAIQATQGAGGDEWTVTQVRVAEVLRQAGDFDQARMATEAVPAGQIEKYAGLKRVIEEMRKRIEAKDKTPI